MKFKNKQVLDVMKSYKRLMIAGLVLISLAILLFGSLAFKNKFEFLIIKNKEENNNKYIDSVKDNNYEEEVYLNVSWLSDRITAYDNPINGYYYVFDGEYYYIVYLSKQKAKELYAEDLKNDPVKIIGIPSRIPNHIKKFAIEYYNNSLEEGKEKLTEQTFNQVFGNVYLDQTKSISTISNISDDYIAIVIGVGALLIIISLILTPVGTIFLLSIKKISDADIQILDSEMNNSNSKFYDKVNVYLTPNYLIILDWKMSYYKYSDILWMYSHEDSYNGIRVDKAIEMLTKDAKTTIFANTLFLTKNQKSVYDEIWNTIASKNPDIMLGYTNENITYFKDVVKEIKRKKKI